MNTKEILNSDHNIATFLETEFNHQHFTTLIQTVNEAVWLFDRQLRLVIQNASAEAITGWSTNDAVGLSINKLAPSLNNDLAHELEQILSRTIKHKTSTDFSLEQIWLPRKQGGAVMITGKAIPLFDSKNLVTAVIVTFWEVSAKANESYLRHEFASMASHLFRSPLSYIEAATEFLIGSDLEDNKKRDVLTKMRQQTQRLITLTNNLLGLLRVENDEQCANIEAVCLPPVVQRMMDLIADQKPLHSFNYIENGQAGLPKIAADPTKIEIVLLGLLLHASQRCPEGGNITISTTASEREVIVSIEDCGPPIPPSQQERLFWQFYPIDDDVNKMPSNYKLGLYNTRRLIEIQRGQIWIGSEAQKNPRINFSIPVWEQ